MSAHLFFAAKNVPYYVSPASYMGTRIDNLIHKHELVITLESQIKHLYDVINTLTEDQIQLQADVQELQATVKRLLLLQENAQPR